MGNKQGKGEALSEQNASASRQKKHSGQRPADRNKIPRDMFMKFINCLQRLPFRVSEDQFQEISDVLELLSFNGGDIILEMKKEGKGIFIVMDGFCNVLSNDESTVLRIIEEEDFFGEISTFYSVLCTTTVVSGQEGCQLLLLRREDLVNFSSRPIDYPMFDWFVERRYLDTAGMFQTSEILNSIAMSCFQHAPPFLGWSKQAITAVRESLSPNIIDFYPLGSELVAAGDMDSSAFLLVYGSIELISTRNESLEILSAGPLGLWFADEQLFCGTERQLTVRAFSPCLIITITSYCFSFLLEDFPVESAKLINISNRWKKFVNNRNSELYEEYAGQLGLEILRLALRKSSLLTEVPSGFIYMLALSITVKEVTQGEIIFNDQDCREYIFILLNGLAILESESEVVAEKYHPYDIFFVKDSMPPDIYVRALETSVVGIFPLPALKEIQDIYPDAVLNWTATESMD